MVKPSALSDRQRSVLAEAVRRARVEKGWSIEAAAESARMSPVTWARIEAAFSIREDSLYRAVSTLGWSWDDVEQVISSGRAGTPTITQTPPRPAAGTAGAERLRILTDARDKLVHGLPLTELEAATVREQLEDDELGSLRARIELLSREEQLQVSRYVDSLLSRVNDEPFDEIDQAFDPDDDGPEDDPELEEQVAAVTADLYDLAAHTDDPGYVRDRDRPVPNDEGA